MARDENIGLVKPDSIKVEQIEEVIAATKEATQELEAAVDKLERIRKGQELILGQEIETE